METRFLTVKLTAAEFEARASQMASASAEAERLADERKTTAARYKNQIDELEATVRKLARAIESRAEDRNVECEWVKDLDAGVMRLERRDTRAVVESRALTPKEKTGDLFPADAPEGEPIDEATGAPTGAPVTAMLVTAEDWERVPPGQRKRLTDMLERYDVSFAPVDGVFRTSRLTIGGRGLLGFEMLCREFGLRAERGDVLEAATGDESEEEEESEESDDVEPTGPVSICVSAAAWEAVPDNVQRSLLSYCKRHKIKVEHVGGGIQTQPLARDDEALDLLTTRLTEDHIEHALLPAGST